MLDTPFEYKGTVDSTTRLCTQGVEIIQPNKYGESRVAITRLCTVAGITVGTELLIPIIGMTNRVLFAAKIAKDAYTASVDSTGATVLIQYLPKVGDIVALGTMGSISAKYRVKKVSPDKSGKFDFTLIPYNESLYSYGAEIPTFQNHMSIPDRSSGDTYNLEGSVSTEQLMIQLNSIAEVWLGDLSDFPSSPVKGWKFHNTTDGNSYYYDGTEWVVYAYKGDTGAKGDKGDTGDPGPSGSSKTFNDSNTSLSWNSMNVMKSSETTVSLPTNLTPDPVGSECSIINAKTSGSISIDLSGNTVVGGVQSHSVLNAGEAITFVKVGAGQVNIVSSHKND